MEKGLLVKKLKVARDQGFHGGPIFRADLPQAVFDARLEGIESFVVFAVQRLALDELPETFNQIQIRRIGRQEEKFDAQQCGQIQDEPTVLIAGIVEH